MIETKGSLRCQPVDERVDGALWLLEMNTVARLGDRSKFGVRQCGCHSFGDCTELLVVFTDQQQDWATDLNQAIPEGRLGPGASKPQARSQAVGGVAQSILPHRLVRRQASEQWVPEPFVDERFDADCLDSVGEEFVVGSTLGAGIGVVDPRSRSDQDQPLNRVRVSEGGVQADTSTHRVTDVGGAAACRYQVISGAPQVGANVAGRPVTREIDCTALVETA